MGNLFDKPRKDARLQGVIPDQNAAGDILCVVTPTEGTKTFTWSFPFNCDFNGISIYSHVVSPGDHVIRLETRYGPGNVLRYKKFGKNWPLMNGDRQDILLFPTQPSAGIQLRMDIKNVGSTDLKLSLGLFTFIDQVDLDVMIGEQGVEW
jgi:hypothetical protein